MTQPSAMSAAQILARFIEKVPRSRTHMFCFFADRAARGDVRPFVGALVDALVQLENAEPGVGAEFVDRIAAVSGIGEDPFEALIQILAEVYVACGAATAAIGSPGRGRFAQ